MRKIGDGSFMGVRHRSNGKSSVKLRSSPKPEEHSKDIADFLLGETKKRKVCWTKKKHGGREHEKGQERTLQE